MSLELVAIHYGVPDDIAKVLIHCSSLMKFDKITLFHPRPLRCFHPKIEVIKVESDGNNHCCINEVPKMISCDHVLGVHWDGVFFPEANCRIICLGNSKDLQTESSPSSLSFSLNILSMSIINDSLFQI